MRPRLQWWAEEAEWLAARLDRCLAACQGLGQGIGQGYSKLHSSDQPRHSRARSAPKIPEDPEDAPPPRTSSRSTLRACAQRLQSMARRSSRATVNNPAAEPCNPACTRLRRQPTQPRAPSPVTPTAVVFEKCRPRGRSGASSPSLPAVDIVYYPFRVENCVVCRQLGAAAASAASAVSLTAVPCPREGCCAPYVPTPQQQASGASGALLFRGQSPTPLGAHLPPPPPRPHCGEREPVSPMNHDFFEVRYDSPPSEQPPPSYQTAMRKTAAAGRRNLVAGDTVVDNLGRSSSPRHATRAPVLHYQYDDEDDDDEDTIYSRDSVAAMLEREMASWRPPQPRYRSHGRFSSVMYETQRMFEEAFQVASEEVPVAVRLPARGRSVAAGGAAMTRAWSVHGPPAQHLGLREVAMPSVLPSARTHRTATTSPGLGLRGLLSFRRAKARTPQCGPQRPDPVPAPATTTSARPQKKVVVGERGLRGPVWPRVILTFDRGVTPYAQ